MGAYYYFVATLPSLSLAAEAPMSGEDFLSRCEDNLSSADLAIIRQAALHSPPEGPAALVSSSVLLSAYHDWERSLRNELVKLRSRRLGRSGESWLRPGALDGRAVAAANAIMQSSSEASTPLEGELALERERWARIEELKALHAFDLETIIAYRLQLAILERLALLKAEAGEAGYREIYAAILGTAGGAAEADASAHTGVIR